MIAGLAELPACGPQASIRRRFSSIVKGRTLQVSEDKLLALCNMASMRRPP